MSRIAHKDEIEFRVPISKYAAGWQRWLNGSTWALTPGEDFDCSIPAFRAHTYYIARTYGITIRTRIQDGLFYLQADPAASDWQPGQ